MIKTISVKQSWQCRILNFILRFWVSRKLAKLASEPIAEKQLQKVIKLRAQLDRIASPVRGMHSEQILLNNISTLVITPQKVSSQKVIFYVHGGAYAMGSAKLFADFCARFAEICQCKLYVFDYRLMPEHALPAAVHDATAAYQALLQKHAAQDIIFAGDSAGGGLALTTIVNLIQKQLPVPGAAVCFSPWTDLAFTGGTIKTNRDKDCFIRIPEHMTYLSNLNVQDCLVSPLYADLKGFPPLFFQVGADEVLLDDSLRFAEKAEKAQVKVEVEIWEHVPHAWQIFARILPEAKTALQHVAEYINANSR